MPVSEMLCGNHRARICQAMNVSRVQRRYTARKYIPDTLGMGVAKQL